MEVDSVVNRTQFFFTGWFQLFSQNHSAPSLSPALKGPSGCGWGRCPACLSGVRWAGAVSTAGPVMHRCPGTSLYPQTPPTWTLHSRCRPSAHTPAAAGPLQATPQSGPQRRRKLPPLLLWEVREGRRVRVSCILLGTVMCQHHAGKNTVCAVR